MKNEFKEPELSVADLSESLYQVSRKLQDANEELRKKDQEKSEFYANISHDLRAPITAISNSVEYMQSNPNMSQEELEATLEVVALRTDYLKQLINDIFLLASLESSTATIHPEPVDVRFLIEDFFYMCEEDTAYKDCHLKLELTDSFVAANPVLNLDPRMMNRVFDNLFNNALKYSDDSPVITLKADLVEDNVLQISVTDEGIGIAPDNLDKIFERSFRVDYSRNPNGSSGGGFGLPIVKTIVERLGGCVTCESELGAGTQVTISFVIL